MEVMAMPVVMAVMTMPVMAMAMPVVSVMAVPVMAVTSTVPAMPTVTAPASKSLTWDGQRGSGQRQSRDGSCNDLLDPRH
jgi:hypothetical protein